MLIGILQTGEAPDVLSAEMGDYPDMFRRLLDGKGFAFRTYRVLDMDFPASVHDCDGWLITGSRHGVYEEHAFIPPLEAFIRAAREERVPLVGICFGHQIVAQALGGRVERSDKGWAVGPTAYDFGGDRIVLNAWHRDQVIEPPDGAEVIASNSFCENAALLYGDYAFTVQAHPEFRDDFVEGLMRTRGPGVVPDDRLRAAEERLGQPNDAGRLADRIAQFFNQAR
ncbi:type 1 glutamine amidotransferase [Cereibacter johrii]|uniref:GMP synthase-like glutamine amidotransferase n=1 Tax=Cereibacter johrii TaxID=445629 RepID=A0ABX5JAZ0_9RHOB|nr:type 1 glutamine amidotransferase [Cereibacter johrii]ODM43418.1 glutamine amidotransferase [Cereibacter johrii]PTM80623.1 GMP synthase-like glutamine amidotransferase [Cereibacter johrii]RAZ83976.1 type 1 glutamine amidotransferase [Cereibacter johrii]